jgi:hypothetical protein
MKAADFDWFLGWLCQRLRSSNEEHSQAAVAVLQKLLSMDVYRARFFETPDGVSRLVDVAKNSPNNLQTQYQAIFCLWLLSFSKPIAATLNKYVGQSRARARPSLLTAYGGARAQVEGDPASGGAAPRQQQGKDDAHLAGHPAGTTRGRTRWWSRYTRH